jgi:hypothetical protein
VKGDGKTCDEFPFFTTNQAVDLTLPDKSLRADVRLTPTEEGGFQVNQGRGQPVHETTAAGDDAVTMLGEH